MSYNLRECKVQNSQFVQYRLEYNTYVPFVILLSLVSAVVPWFYILWTKWEEW
jgi:hypothetical protein